MLGSGTFGQVVKCRNIKTDEVVAIKVVKNKLAYFKQSMMEVAILEMVMLEKRKAIKYIYIHNRNFNICVHTCTKINS